MTAGPAPDPRAVTTKAEWAAALTALRVRADLSIRELARRTEIPHPTLGGYFSGRNLPQAGQVSTLTTILENLAVAPTDADAWIAATQRVRSTAAAPVPRPASPYPGLASFGVGDAAVFFGRADETDEVLARLAALRDDLGPSHGMLAVVGPSGSGKSSLLRAGVAATLCRAGDSSSCVVMTPGAEPAAALAAALAAPGPAGRVLVVDQFEELFTAVTDPLARTEFLDALAALPHADPPTLVVLGMRADFYSSAAREPRLVPALKRAQIVIGPLGPDALRQAVVGPAAAVGVTVEDGLVELVLADADPRGTDGQAHDAGALPLLSHALLSAWEGGSGRTLTIADYRTAGGVDGAVQRTAEDVYTALDDAGRTAARALFLRLVHLSDDVTITRRRLSGAELDALQDDDTTVVDEFVDRRLLTAGTAGTAAHENSIEISHEALVSGWPRLRGWIDADRDALRLHRTVTEAANAWEQAGRDETLLLRGGRLEAATETASAPSLWAALNQLERTYITSGVAARDGARAHHRRRTRRLRRLFAAVAVLVLLAAGLAAYSLRARSEALAAGRAAGSARDDALSRQVAIEARQLVDRDPALAQQLALASYRIAPTAEARSALTDFSARPIVTRLLGTPGRTPQAMARSGARLVAVGQADGAVRLVRVVGDRPRIVATLPSSGKAHPVAAVAFTPDARTLFVLDDVDRLVAWDVGRPTTARRLSSTALAAGVTPSTMSVDPSGKTLLVGGSGATPLQRWRVDVPTRPTRTTAPVGLPRGIELYAVAQSPDGRYVAAGGDSGYAYRWDSTRPRAAPTRTRTGANLQLAVLFGGGRLYVGDSEGAVTAIAPSTGRVLGVAKKTGAGWAQTLTLSSDGKTLGVGSDDSTFRQFSTSTYALLDEQTSPKEVVSASYLPDDSGVVLSCVDGATYVVPRRGNQVPSPATTYNLFFDRTGDRMLASTGGGGGGARVWDVRGTTPTAVTPFIRMISTKDPATGGGSLSPDGDLVAVNNFVGQVQLFDISDPARPRPWGAPFRAADELVESLSMSPRGQLLGMGSDDGSVSVWDVSRPASPTVLARMRGTGAFYDVAWNRDATMLAASSADPAVYLWSVADPRHPMLLATIPLPTDDAGGVTFSHDGRLLAATGSDGRTRLWDITDPRHPRSFGAPLVGPTDYTNSASFSPDDSLLVVSSADSTVRIYDVDSPLRTPAVTLEDVGGPVNSAQFSPDGSHLVASGRADTASVWTVDPVAASRELCARSGSGITRAEWTQHVPGATYASPCR